MKKKEVTFSTVILKFGKQGEKTGWRYILIPEIEAQQLFPGNRKSFRVSGAIDKFKIDKTAVMPMGDGSFILAINAAMRKATGKDTGQKLSVSLKHDPGELALDKDLVACLEEDTVAKMIFFKLTPGHRNYFSKWISQAKTDTTKARRIALTLDALVRNMDFGQMLREEKKRRQ